MLLYVAIFVLCLTAILLVLWSVVPSRQGQRSQAAIERLEAYDTRSFRQAELGRPATERLLGPAFGRLAAAARLLTPVGRIKRLEDKVEQAGRPWNLDVNGLLVIKLLSLLAGVLILVVLASLQILAVVWFVLLAVVVIVATYYLPDLLLRAWAKERKRLISRALPDFLDLLTVTVEAGLGLDSSFAKIAEKVKGPLGEELLITLHHMRIGQSRETALREFARRCNVPDMDSFVSALIQSQKLGVSLGKILRAQSVTIRTVRRQRIQEAGQQATVKMLFPLMVCIFPSLFVVILGPAAIRIYQAFN